MASSMGCNRNLCNCFGFIGFNKFNYLYKKIVTYKNVLLSGKEKLEKMLYRNLV